MKRAAGIIHVARDGSVLLLKRAGVEGVDNFVGHWALPGGSVEDGEAPIAGAHRETIEECGYDGRGPMRELDQVETPNGMTFHTFVRPVQKFTPKLNHEHSEHAWANLDDLPQPMHPAVEKTLQRIPHAKQLFGWACDSGDLAQDSVHAPCGGRGCAGCGGSGVSPITYAPAKPGLASDEFGAELLAEIARQAATLGPGLAFDRAPEGLSIDRAGIVVTLAFDKASESVRRTDNFARLHVKSSPITKACVSPYYGREIPNSAQLGLEPARVYRLLRHPDEIKKAAKTSHNIPLLSRHVPHTADDHDGEITVGTTGSNAEYVHPYLMNSLAVWSREGIDHVESGDQKELSSAYSYDADMTPGVYEGEPYDGIMRNMVFNHVALVKKGRAGSDVVVGDEALKPNEETTMAKKIASLKAGVAYGVLRGHLSTVKLAQDAALPDVRPLFAGVKAGGFNKKTVKAIASGVGALLKGKLAQDADLAGVVKGVEQLMASVEGDKTVKDAEIGEEIDPAAPDDAQLEVDEGGAEDDGGLEAIAAYLKEKGVPDDVIAGLPGMAPPAQDGGPTDEMAARLAKAGAKDKDTVENENGDDGKKKPFAMDEDTLRKRDERIKKETMETMRGIDDARAKVQPIVGVLPMAFDSADGVYQQAFKMIGNTEAAKLEGKALAVAWSLVKQPGRGSNPTPTPMAMDEGEDSFEKRFPNAAKVKSVGR